MAGPGAGMSHGRKSRVTRHGEPGHVPSLWPIYARSVPPVGLGTVFADRLREAGVPIAPQSDGVGAGAGGDASAAWTCFKAIATVSLGGLGLPESAFSSDLLHFDPGEEIVTDGFAGVERLENESVFRLEFQRQTRCLEVAT